VKHLGAEGPVLNELDGLTCLQNDFSEHIGKFLQVKFTTEQLVLAEPKHAEIRDLTEVIGNDLLRPFDSRIISMSFSEGFCFLVLGLIHHCDNPIEIHRMMPTCILVSIQTSRCRWWLLALEAQKSNFARPIREAAPVAGTVQILRRRSGEFRDPPPS
jgi:hypothetical protein